MSRTSTNGKPKGGVVWAPVGTHPSEVSGVFKDDPAFDEFLEILREQREEDLRQTMAEYAEETRKTEENERCSSSTPTPSLTTKKPTRSSRRK